MTTAVPRHATPHMWNAWVAGRMDALLAEPGDAESIAREVRDEALRQLTWPPTEHFLLFVQYQHDMNYRTWPRAWALVTYIKVASWYYRRKR